MRFWKWSLLGITLLSVLIFVFYPDDDWQPLDGFKDGDTAAKPGDLKITDDTMLYVMYGEHPTMTRVYVSVGSEKRNFKRKAYSIGKRILSKTGISSENIVTPSSPDEFVNNGKNLLVTFNLGVNKLGHPYNYTATARQGDLIRVENIVRDGSNPGHVMNSFPDHEYRWYDIVGHINHYFYDGRLKWIGSDHYSMNADLISDIGFKVEQGALR